MQSSTPLLYDRFTKSYCGTNMLKSCYANAFKKWNERRLPHLQHWNVRHASSYVDICKSPLLPPLYSQMLIQNTQSNIKRLICEKTRDRETWIHSLQYAKHFFAGEYRSLALFFLNPFPLSDSCIHMLLPSSISSLFPQARRFSDRPAKERRNRIYMRKWDA